MQIGVTLPNHRGIDDVDAVVAIGSLAEEMQFDSVWASDHLLNDSHIEKRIGQRPYYSPLACLTYLAGVTKSIRLGTSVLTLPLYPPVELAKYVATLDQLSHGRVILGVGAGATPSEYAAVGLNFGDRGPLLDESLEVMSRVWSEPRVTLTTPRVTLNDGLVTPKPIQSPLPVWIGGWSDAAIRRAAAYGTGWHSSGLSFAELRAAIKRVDEYAAAIGRPDIDRVFSVRVPVDFDEDLGPGSGSKDIIPANNLGVAADRLKRYQEVGVSHVVFSLETANLDRIRKTMDDIAFRVRP
jgi:probable F420-dependent oxidoreductase